MEKIKKRLQEVEANQKQRELELGINSEDSETSEGEKDDAMAAISAKDPSKFRQHAEAIKREAIVIKALQEKEEALPSPSLLLRWYKLDENHVPAVYRLQKIRYVFLFIS